ncbi:hypothetical protein GN958_ATG19434 [Phytophthora infestans]|uniref:Secreted RxLR effector peptide protein n=1 Tax=Phytophthora infestans TaxID=4787 RepID=A0A8S9TXI1_PHYIN|nr:hypothetical protein GN958_ATG19434 [Phytophthora infestans]
MKASVVFPSIMTLLVVTVLSVSEALADQSTVANGIDNLLHTLQPVSDEKASWAPIRALETMGSPQQQENTTTTSRTTKARTTTRTLSSIEL